MNKIPTAEINNNIQESYCSEQVRKLLKEKGWLPVDGETYKSVNGVFQITQSVAIEWIRVNFNHDIESRGVRYAGDDKSSYYQPYVNGASVLYRERYKTPQEATEAALLYTLQNLIP